MTNEKIKKEQERFALRQTQNEQLEDAMRSFEREFKQLCDRYKVKWNVRYSTALEFRRAMMKMERDERNTFRLPG